jgi:hypothetical protein
MKVLSILSWPLLGHYWTSPSRHFERFQASWTLSIISLSARNNHLLWAHRLPAFPFCLIVGDNGLAADTAQDFHALAVVLGVKDMPQWAASQIFNDPG